MWDIRRGSERAHAFNKIASVISHSLLVRWGATVILLLATTTATTTNTTTTTSATDVHQISKVESCGR